MIAIVCGLAEMRWLRAVVRPWSTSPWSCCRPAWCRKNTRAVVSVSQGPSANRYSCAPVSAATAAAGRAHTSDQILVRLRRIGVREHVDLRLPVLCPRIEELGGIVPLSGLQG